jgi:hypothetical protein
MASLKEQMFQEVAEDSQIKSSNKVTVVGIGAVGMAAAFSILTQASNFIEKKILVTNLVIFFVLRDIRMFQVTSLLLMSLRIN